MRILLTGVSGFVGSYLAERLVKEANAEVYGLVRWTSYSHIPNLGNLIGKIKLVYGDVREPDSLKKAFKECEPDLCVHLAALTHVEFSFYNALSVYESNLKGTINIAHECLEHDAYMIFAGTSEEYGNQRLGELPIKETNSLRPISPYACSKVAADQYLRFLNEAYGFKVTILRPFNTYGRKFEDRFITEKIISSMLSGGPVMLGSPKTARDFNYVDDIVKGYMLVIKKRPVGEVINLCSGVATTIRDLTLKIKAIVGYKGKIVFNAYPPRPLDPPKLVGDNRRARELLGWQPRYTLEEGLKRTIEWWRG